MAVRGNGGARVTAPHAFARAGPAFEAAAAAAGGVVVRSYTIAGLSVTLEFAGSALVERLSGAFGHHPPGKPAGPGLVVSIWDSASTGVPLPPVPGEAIDGGTSGAARVGEVPDVRAKYRPDLRILWMLDRAGDAAVFCVADGSDLPYWESGSPLRLILHWWMADRGRQLVHAAAVGTPAGGALVVGEGGRGKSSTALACVGSRLGYAADDYCLVTLQPEPRAHTLYSSGKLEPEQARRFPHLAPALVNADRLETEKALFLLHRSHPDCFQHAFPVRAVVVPAISGGRLSWLEPTSAGTALAALAPSTILQLPGAGGAALSTLARLVRRVPAYVLHLGRDLSTVPPVLERLIDDPRRAMDGQGAVSTGALTRRGTDDGP